MSVIIPKENDYKGHILSVPKYKYRDISPNSTVTLALNSSVNGVFELPSNIVYNLGKSYLEFGINIPAQAADFVNIHGIITPITGVSLITERGQNLINQQWLHPYRRLATLAALKGDNSWKNRDKMADNTTQRYSGVGPINQLGSANYGKFINDASTMSTGPVDYLSAQSCFSSAVDNTDLDMYYKIPLKELAMHSLLSMDKDLYMSGESLSLTVTFGASTQFGFDSDDAAMANAGNLDATAVMSGLKLVLAVQDEPRISLAVQQAVMTNGIKLNFGYVNEVIVTTDNSTAFSNTVKLNLSRGSRLLRIYSGLMLNSSAIARWNVDNTAGAKWTTVRARLDNNYESEYSLTPVQYWEQNNDLLKDSAIFSFLDWSAHAPVYISDYTGLSASNLLTNENIESGVPLHVPHEYTLEFVKTAEAQNFASFVVCQKTLAMLPSGVEVLLD